LLVAVHGGGGDDGREPERDRDQDLDSRFPGAGGSVAWNGHRVLWVMVPPWHRDLLLVRPAWKLQDKPWAAPRWTVAPVAVGLHLDDERERLRGNGPGTVIGDSYHLLIQRNVLDTGGRVREGRRY
jgi:hypothetical protein